VAGGLGTLRRALCSKRALYAVIAAIKSLLMLSVAAMCWWVFAWPFVVSANPTNVVCRYASIATLLIFFGCIVVLLAVRLASGEEAKN
jgi:hypothetical protein